MENENKIKHDFLMHMLSEGDAMVCLDARRPDVDVPSYHKTNPLLNLIFNLNFKRPMEFTEDAIYATLAFGGRPHKCVIPFSAVWAIYEPKTLEGQVWEESIPKDIDLAERLKKSQGTPVAPQSMTPSQANSTAQPKKADKPRRDRSHLRVIK